MGPGGGPGRPGPLAACPSAGREVRLTVLRPHSPPPALGLQPPPRQSPLRVRTCAGPPSLPPHAGAKGARRARVRPPSARPPSCSRRPPAGVSPAAQPGGRGPGRHCLALPVSRPLPGPARSSCRGARTCLRRAELYGGGGCRWGGESRDRGTGEGAGAGDRRAPRSELRPRPARTPGELAQRGTGRRVMVWGEGAGAPIHRPPLPSRQIWIASAWA